MPKKNEQSSNIKSKWIHKKKKKSRKKAARLTFTNHINSLLSMPIPSIPPLITSANITLPPRPSIPSSTSSNISLPPRPRRPRRPKPNTSTESNISLPANATPRRPRSNIPPSLIRPANATPRGPNTSTESYISLPANATPRTPRSNISLPGNATPCGPNTSTESHISPPLIRPANATPNVPQIPDLVSQSPIPFPQPQTRPPPPLQPLQVSPIPFPPRTTHSTHTTHSSIVAHSHTTHSSSSRVNILPRPPSRPKPIIQRLAPKLKSSKNRSNPIFIPDPLRNGYLVTQDGRINNGNSKSWSIIFKYYHIYWKEEPNGAIGKSLLIQSNIKLIACKYCHFKWFYMGDKGNCKQFNVRILYTHSYTCVPSPKMAQC